MKSALKGGGLYVGNTKDHYLVFTGRWGIYVEQEAASNKFKAAIMELIGDLPEYEECYHYTIGEDKGIKMERVMHIPYPYEMWKQAKDVGIGTPIYLNAWPHEYLVCQKKSDLGFLVVPRSLTTAVISASELNRETERMPGHPSILGDSTLYFKNEFMIYWVHTVPPGERALKVLFPRLKGISFFKSDWIGESSEEETGEEAEGAEGAAGELGEPDSLPY